MSRCCHILCQKVFFAYFEIQCDIFAVFVQNSAKSNDIFCHFLQRGLSKDEVVQEKDK